MAMSGTAARILVAVTLSSHCMLADAAITTHAWSMLMHDAVGEAVQPVVSLYRMNLKDLASCRVSVADEVGARITSLSEVDARRLVIDVFNGNAGPSLFGTDVARAASEILTHIEGHTGTMVCLTKWASSGGVTATCGDPMRQLKDAAVGTLLRMPNVTSAILDSIKQHCEVK